MDSIHHSMDSIWINPGKVKYWVWPAVFSKLKQELVLKGGLSPSRWVDTSEMLAIFLYQVVTNSAIRKAAERFQRSNETISK